MCFVVLFFRAVADAPLVIAANREEVYTRPSEPPQLWPGPRRFLAGRDVQAGGTWLGVNEGGLVVAVTNRPKQDVPPAPRSRGLLVRDLLAGCATAAAAVAQAQKELASGRYAGCNLLCADSQDAVVLHAGDWLQVQPLPPGLHLLTTQQVNFLGDARLAYARWWLSQFDYEKAADCLNLLPRLCSQRGEGAPPICLAGAERGTLSSTLLALCWDPAQSVYRQTPGPPDRTPYVDYSLLLRSLLCRQEEA